MREKGFKMVVAAAMCGLLILSRGYSFAHDMGSMDMGDRSDNPESMDRMMSMVWAH